MAATSHNPVRPKIKAVAFAGSATSVIVWLLSAYVFQNNPATPQHEGVPDDLLAILTFLVPVLVATVAGYLKRDEMSPPTGPGVDH